MTDDDRQWLRDLKYVRMVTSFSIVHATLDGPQRWGYVFDKLAAAASFTYQNTSVCFFGHTHVPVAFVRDSMVRGGTYSKFKVEPGKKYFVNVGAVGQPRDNNPKAAYVVYDVDEGTIELRRLDYDIATAQKKILDAGLPTAPGGTAGLRPVVAGGPTAAASRGAAGCCALPVKILILKPSSLGDVVHALPVLRLLKRHPPHSQIYLVDRSGSCPAAGGRPRS